MDTAIDRSIFPAGVHWRDYDARISRVAYTLLGSTPPKLSDTKKPILRKTTERSFAGLYPMYAGLWTLTRTYSCTVRDWPVKQKQMANTTHTHRSSKRRQH